MQQQNPLSPLKEATVLSGGHDGEATRSRRSKHTFYLQDDNGASIIMPPPIARLPAAHLKTADPIIEQATLKPPPLKPAQTNQAPAKQANPFSMGIKLANIAAEAGAIGARQNQHKQVQDASVAPSIASKKSSASARTTRSQSKTK